MDIESRYEFLEKIGSGSFATVYRARDNELGREVAVKRIHEEYMAETSKLEQFWSEAQLLASLQHPNIVTIYDLYRDRGWLILELMQTNLADRMQGRPMDVRAAKTTVAHCLRALEYLHQRGITHGDVKPSNMMIDARKRIKIGDFGLARRASDEEGSLLKGTTKYMAPEVVSDEFGDIGPASDLYSLGFSAYQLLCGDNFEQLFPGLSAFGRNKQVAWMMWHAAPDRRVPEISRVLEGVPEDLANVVDKLVRKPQTERYRTAQQALDDLVVDQKIVKEVQGAAPESTDADPGRRKRLLLLGGVMLVSLVLSAVMLFQPTAGDNTETAPDVVVFREHVDADSIKVGFVDREGATQLDFEDEPVILLREMKKDSYILLSELQDGDRLEFEKADGRTKVTVSRPVRTHGRIAELKPADRTIVLAPDDGSEDLPLRVPETAGITRNGRAAKLADLEEADVVDVWHLHELKGRPGRVVDRVELTKAEPPAIGFVESLDPTALTITVRTEEGVPPLTLKIAEDATITLDNMGAVARAKVADLKPGDRVRVIRDALVREIVATRDQNDVRGTVAALEPRLGTLTVQLDSGESRTFLVGPRTDIRIGSNAARLEDLRRTDKLVVTYRENADRTTFDASSLTVDRPTRANRWVLLVATSGYRRGVPEVPYALADARRLAATFRERYGVADDRCILLLDSTRAQLEKDIEEKLARVAAGSELIVYLGGHAFLGSDGQPYLGAADLEPARPEGSGLPLSWIVERMESTPAATKLLLLDTSHGSADAARQPATEAMGDLLSERSTTAILASCSRGEQGRSSTIAKHGLFASALADGYAGPADTDVNYDRDVAVNVSPREIERFTRDRLSTAAPRQTPTLLEPRP